jgi:hypothetical protein
MREALRARGAKVIPLDIGLWPAMLFLAPEGNELAQTALALALRAGPIPEDTPPNEDLFQDRRYIALLYAALDAHPDHAGTHTALVHWHQAGTAAAESARLIEWFCATHPMRALRIERDIKIRMRKQGWRV